MTTDYETRHAQAQAYHQAGLKRVRTTPEPEGQKFPCGSRVRIADDLGASMRHFPAGKNATVQYVYSHAYGQMNGGSNVKDYSLDIDGMGSHAWYHEHQLTAIPSNKPKFTESDLDNYWPYYKSYLIDILNEEYSVSAAIEDLRGLIDSEQDEGEKNHK